MRKSTIVSLIFFTVISVFFVPSKIFADSSEYVYLAKVYDSDYEAIIVRKNGDAYLIEYGVGVISIWRYEGEFVVINSPSLFAGVGSTIVLPDEDEEATIWDAEFLGNIYETSTSVTLPEQPVKQEPKQPTKTTKATKAVVNGNTNQEVKVFFNDQPVTFNGTQPAVINNRVMVPYRTIVQLIPGASVVWDKKNKLISIYNLKDVVRLKLGSKVAWINGKKTMLDTAPVVINGSTLVPIRFLAESLVAEVYWEQKTKTVNIFYMR
ncbi:stalk domain-containing protein [Paenibacillus cisolokensis]|uniref:stalk domain-containing protein n=1 Tax=Paenibacillus cisolokensis TaxID=1658519 RepID=UPI003D2D329C